MRRTFALTFGAALLLASGCMGSVSDPALLNTSSRPPSQEKKFAPGTASEPCASLREVLSWQLPTTYNAAGDKGSQPFKLGDGTTQFVVKGSSGNAVMAKWAFSIESSNGTRLFNHEIIGPINAVGNDNSVPTGKEATTASPGDYRFKWSVSGVITKLGVSVSAGDC